MQVLAFFIIIIFFLQWVYMMLYDFLLFRYKKPAKHNLLKHDNISAAVAVILLLHPVFVFRKI